MGEFIRRLRYLLFHRRFDRELENEMEFHREMAARQGRRNFGNTLRLRERSREAWGWTWIDRLLQDLRYAARILWHSPGFTITALFVLSLGIGVCVSGFTLLNIVALRLLPVRDPASIVRLDRDAPEIHTSETPYLQFAFYRDHTKTLSAMFATMGSPGMELDQDLQPVSVDYLTANYYSELGAKPALGRLFNPTRDASPDAPPVVVLNYLFWQRRFNADPGIVGRVIHLNKKPVTVIGVVSSSTPSVEGADADVCLPMSKQPYFVEGSKALTDTSDGGAVRMWGRLAPGVSAKAAEAELLTLTNELRKIYPKMIWDKQYIRSRPGGHLLMLQPEMNRVFTMIASLLLLIFIVACANLGSLMTARGVAREHEIGIRIAIGAGKLRIFRQLFTESLLLAAIGAAGGLALSYAGLRSASAYFGNVPPWITFAPDWRVVLFALVMTLASAIVFGFLPALQIARQRQRKTAVRQVLIGAQIAASCILLIVSALLVRAVHHVLYSDPGFGYEGVLSINPDLQSHGYTPEQARAYLTQLEDRLRALTGVTSVAESRIPLLGNGFTAYMTIDMDGHPVNVYPNWVDPVFFKTMEIPLVRGRNFQPSEKHVVIVSESLAKRQWRGKDALGQKFGDAKDLVIGIAGDARIKSLNDNDATEIYWAAQSENLPTMTVLVKASGPLDSLATQSKAIVESLDPKIFPYIWTLKSGFRDFTRILENCAIGVSLLGIVAALLSGVGIVGLVAYAISQRTKELAIRIALGAKPAHVLSVVLKQFTLPVVIGAILGGATTAAVSQVLRKVLFGVSNLDPFSYAGGIIVLIAIAVGAALLPARRALRVDPVRALHEE